MLNSLEDYREAGYRVALSRRHGTPDAEFFFRWYVEALRLERGDDKRRAEEAYIEGYKSLPPLSSYTISR